MNKGLFIEPTWKRLGFSDIPDLDRSGKDVGIVILDMIRPHSKIRHLNKRLKYIIVNDDFSITSREPIEKPEDFSTSYGERFNVPAAFYHICPLNIMARYTPGLRRRQISSS